MVSLFGAFLIEFVRKLISLFWTAETKEEASGVAGEAQKEEADENGESPAA